MKSHPRYDWGKGSIIVLISNMIHLDPLKTPNIHNTR